MNVDVRWRGDAAPKDSIRFGGMKHQSSGEAGNGYAAQQETVHLLDPPEGLCRCYARSEVKPRRELPPVDTEAMAELPGKSLTKS